MTIANASAPGLLGAVLAEITRSMFGSGIREETRTKCGAFARFRDDLPTSAQAETPDRSRTPRFSRPSNEGTHRPHARVH